MRRDISTELKEPRLYGMAGAWDELTTHAGKLNDVGMQTSRWLLKHLLHAEHTQRAFASVRHQMKAAKFLHTETWQALTSRPKMWKRSWSAY